MDCNSFADSIRDLFFDLGEVLYGYPRPRGAVGVPSTRLGRITGTRLHFNDPASGFPKEVASLIRTVKCWLMVDWPDWLCVAGCAFRDESGASLGLILAPVLLL